MPKNTVSASDASAIRDFQAVVAALDMIPLDSDLTLCCLKVATAASVKGGK